MRIKEIFAEAISVSSYEGPLVNTINKAIHNSIANLRSLKGRFEKEEADLEDSDSSLNLFKKAIAPHLISSLTAELTGVIRGSINYSAGKTIVSRLKFAELEGNIRGYAQDQNAVLSSRYITALAKRISAHIFDMVYSSYNDGERADGFYFIVRMIGSADDYYTSRIDDATASVVRSLTNTALHELVHVVQHNQQKLRGRDDTEYRSYLDKHKGEFNAMAFDRAGSSNSDEKNNDRYYDLYLSSPQEIAAFAHNAALNIVKDYGFTQATDVGEIVPVSPNSIMLAVDKVTGGRFKNPKNPKDAMIRKRYLKLVYQEVQRYLDQLRSRLEKQQPPNNN